MAIYAETHRPALPVTLGHILERPSLRQSTQLAGGVYDETHAHRR